MATKIKMGKSLIFLLVSILTPVFMMLMVIISRYTSTAVPTDTYVILICIAILSMAFHELQTLK